MATPVIGSYGEKINLRIKQGSTFGPVTVTLQNPDETPVNLTGCTLRAQIRKKALDASVLASFVCEITDAVNGIFTYGLTDETTAGFTPAEVPTAADSKAVWDMELEDAAGRVTPLFYGDVEIFREVTRP